MKTFILTMAVVLMSHTAAYAAPEKKVPDQAGNIKVQSIAEQEVEVKLPNGKTEKKRQPVEKAVPGSEVIYTTRFTNQGKQAAGNIAVTNPVPDNTAYVAGSAAGDNTTITYSLDGKNFTTPDKLKLKTPEGSERPALPAEYAHIRWAYKGELAPGKTGEVSFRVRIK
jgi:uncharacterized repeat protein (TIGR01451 family)